MCGRANFANIPWGKFKVEAPEGFVDGRFNVAPTEIIPMVRRAAHGPGRKALCATWGLPAIRRRDGTLSRPLFNARGETVARLPAFREAFKSRRCLVPASGYFEWRTTDKQPFYFVRADGDPLAFAGIFEELSDGLLAVCVITTEANRRCGAIHDRMPAVLAPEDWERWLTPDALTEADRREMLQPTADNVVDFWPVSRAVGNVRNNGAELILRSEAG